MAKVPNLILTKKMLHGFKLLNPVQIASIITGWETWNEGEKPVFPDDMSEFVWRMCEPDFEDMAQKYNATCERNRQNGKRGGAPKKQELIVEEENNPLGYEISEWNRVDASGSESGLIIIGNSNSNNKGNSNGNGKQVGNRQEVSYSLEGDLPPNAQKLSNFVKTKTKPKSKPTPVIDLLEIAGDKYEDKLYELAVTMFADFNASDDYLDEYITKFNELNLEQQIKCLDTYRGYLNYQHGKGKPVNLKYYIQDHKWNMDWLMKYV